MAKAATPLSEDPAIQAMVRWLPPAVQSQLRSPKLTDEQLKYFCLGWQQCIQAGPPMVETRQPAPRPRPAQPSRPAPAPALAGGYGPPAGVSMVSAGGPGPGPDDDFPRLSDAQDGMGEAEVLAPLVPKAPATPAAAAQEVPADGFPYVQGALLPIPAQRECFLFGRAIGNPDFAQDIDGEVRDAILKWHKGGSRRSSSWKREISLRMGERDMLRKGKAKPKARPRPPDEHADRPPVVGGHEAAGDGGDELV